MNMNRKFFVTGLPRSRTTWLSVFLDHAGMWCCHELRGRGETITECRDLLERRPEKIVGTVDSSFPFYADEIIMGFSEPPKIIVIKADPQESYDSLVRAFPGYDHMMDALIQKTRDAIIELCRNHPHAVIDINELDNVDVMASLWETLNPYSDFDVDRYRRLSEIKMNCMPEAYANRLTDEMKHNIYNMIWKGDRI